MKFELTQWLQKRCLKILIDNGVIGSREPKNKTSNMNTTQPRLQQSTINLALHLTGL